MKAKSISDLFYLPLSGTIYLRWKCEQELALHSIPNNFDSSEVRSDWDEVVQSSSMVEYPYGNKGSKYTGLEDIHIFTACNVLARPIIVLCDKIYRSTDGKSLQPSRMGGIYLPILRDPIDCEKSPIVIGYSQCHFVPLLNCEDSDARFSQRPVHPDAQLCVPLVYKDLTHLPVRFTLAHEQREDLLRQFLDCGEIPLNNQQQQQQHGVDGFVLAAILKFKPPPAWSVELMWSLFGRAQDTFMLNVGSAAKYNDPQPVQGSSSQYQKHGGPSNLPAAQAFTEYPGHRSPPAHHTAPTSPNVPKQLTSAQEYQPASQLCGRSRLGCRNPGNPNYDNLCQYCYEFLNPTKHIPVSNRASAASAAAALANGGSFGQLTYSSSSFHGLPGSKCATPQCNNTGIEKLHRLCRECYTATIADQGIETPSPNHVYGSTRSRASDPRHPIGSGSAFGNNSGSDPRYPMTSAAPVGYKSGSDSDIPGVPVPKHGHIFGAGPLPSVRQKVLL